MSSDANFSPWEGMAVLINQRDENGGNVTRSYMPVTAVANYRWGSPSTFDNFVNTIKVGNKSFLAWEPHENEFCILCPPGTIKHAGVVSNPDYYVALRFVPPMVQRQVFALRVGKVGTSEIPGTFTHEYSRHQLAMEGPKYHEFRPIGVRTAAEVYQDFVSGYPVVNSSVSFIDPDDPNWNIQQDSSVTNTPVPGEEDTEPDEFDGAVSSIGGLLTCYRGYAIASSTPGESDAGTILAIASDEPNGEATENLVPRVMFFSREARFVNSNIYRYRKNSFWGGGSHALVYIHPQLAGNVRVTFTLRYTTPSGSGAKLTFYSVEPSLTENRLESLPHSTVWSFTAAGDATGTEAVSFQFSPRMLIDENNGVGYSVVAARLECGLTGTCTFNLDDLAIEQLDRNGDVFPAIPRPFGIG